MSLPSDTRLHPIAAFRAVRSLIRDPWDTRQAFLLVEALRGKTFERQLDRFRATAAGREMLAERRNLLARLSDRATLEHLPKGSLGRAYYDFTASSRLTAEGLVEASKEVVGPPVDEMTWFRNRTREIHDLLHVTTGYGTGPLGEACVAAVTFAQTGLKGFALLAAAAALRIAHYQRNPRVLAAVYEGYRRGRRAAWVFAADWESLLAQPLDVVRARLRIVPSMVYPQLQSSTPGLANDGVMPRAAA